MSKRNQHGALIGGMILIGLGLLFLIYNWLPAWSFWNLFSKYWPLILIWIGLRNLYLYFTYTPRPEAPPPAAPPPDARPVTDWAGTTPQPGPPPTSPQS